MRSNVKRLHEFPTVLDQRIKIAEREIERQAATIASLTRDDHETEDASRHLNALQIKLNDLLRMKIKAK